MPLTTLELADVRLDLTADEPCPVCQGYKTHRLGTLTTKRELACGEVVEISAVFWGERRVWTLRVLLGIDDCYIVERI